MSGILHVLKVGPPVPPDRPSSRRYDTRLDGPTDAPYREPASDSDGFRPGLETGTIGARSRPGSASLVDFSAESRPVVLLVEDDDDLRWLQSIMLSDEGVDVVEASNAHEALMHLEERSDIRLLWTDIEMPGASTGSSWHGSHMREIRG